MRIEFVVELCDSSIVTYSGFSSTDLSLLVMFFTTTKVSVSVRCNAGSAVPGCDYFEVKKFMER